MSGKEEVDLYGMHFEAGRLYTRRHLLIAAEVLRVSKGASKAEIKKAYHKVRL